MSGSYWQHEFMEWNQRVSHLLQSGECCDCTFLVGSEPNRSRLKAHKVILAAASPVFMAMFYGSMAEKGPIEILDLQPEDFETILQYIYTKNASFCSVEKTFSVYYGAKKYMLQSLEKECLLFISLNINPQNICRVYKFARFNDEIQLLDQCVQILTTKTKEVVHNWSLEQDDIGILLTLLSYESLNIGSELDLFQAVEKYFNTYTPRKRILDSYDSLIRKTKKCPHGGDSPAHKFNVKQAVNEAGPSKSEINNREVTQSSSKKANQRESSVECTEDVEKYNCKSNDGEANLSCIFDPNSSNGTLLCCIREAVCKIRFLTLTAQEFANGPALSPLLMETEAFAVLMNILSSQALVPMPRGFSASRVPRNQQYLPTPICRNEVIFRFTVMHALMRKRSVESLPFYFLDMLWSVKLTPRIETTTSGQINRYFALILKCGGPGSTAKLMGADSRLDMNLALRLGPLPYTPPEHIAGSAPGPAVRPAAGPAPGPSAGAAPGPAAGPAPGSSSGPEPGPSKEPGAWSVKIRARIVLVPCVPTTTTVCIDQAGTFSNKRRMWGYNRFVSWDVALSALFLHAGNSITIESYLGEIENRPKE